MANDVLTVEPQVGSAAQAAAHAETLAGALVRVGHGDRDAFEDVYRRTSAKLFGVCLRFLPTRSDAEEALQEVYCSVWRRASLFDARRGTAMTWLITLARNGAIDQLRRAKHTTSLPIEMAGTVPDPRPLAFEAIIAEDDHRRMHRCFDLLSARDSSYIKMAFFGGATYGDLARSACIPVNTMKSRMRRALLQLRDDMA